MDMSISMTRANHEADRLRRIRQHASNLPPGRERDELHNELNTDASALANSRLNNG